eukprot:jgi/Mesvir1/24813/Mv26013-RA.1
MGCNYRRCQKHTPRWHDGGVEEHNSESPAIEDYHSCSTSHHWIPSIDRARGDVEQVTRVIPTH